MESDTSGPRDLLICHQIDNIIHGNYYAKEILNPPALYLSPTWNPIAYGQASVSPQLLQRLSRAHVNRIDGISFISGLDCVTQNLMDLP